MEKTIKYNIEELRAAKRKSDDQQITAVKAINKETNQSCQFIDLTLNSMRLGDELEITIKNNE